MTDIGQIYGCRGSTAGSATSRWTAAGVGRAVCGPLLTLSLAVGFDLLARHGVPILHPFPFLLLAVIYTTIQGGPRPGFVSAIVSIVYALHFFSDRFSLLHYGPVQALHLLAISLLLPGAVVLVARWRAAAVPSEAAVTMDQIVALERRMSFFTEAQAILASGQDYEVALRRLARAIAATLGDWCTIHIVTARGDVRFVAGAHREPSRDLVVRALCEYAPRRLPFGPLEATSELLDVTDPVIDRRAVDPEQAKLYRSLKTISVVRVSMQARERPVGTITIGAGRHFGRRYTADDLRTAEELATRAALAVDYARLSRDAQDTDVCYRMLFEGNPQAMWVFDTESLEFLAVNDAAVNTYRFSRDEFLAMTVIDLRPPDGFPDVMPGFAHENDRQEEVALAQHRRKDGTIVEMKLVSHAMELDGRRARLVLATDVTEQRRVRAALRWMDIDRFAEAADDGTIEFARPDFGGPSPAARRGDEC